MADDDQTQLNTDQDENSKPEESTPEVVEETSNLPVEEAGQIEAPKETENTDDQDTETASETKPAEEETTDSEESNKPEESKPSEDTTSHEDETEKIASEQQSDSTSVETQETPAEEAAPIEEVPTEPVTDETPVPAPTAPKVDDRGGRWYVVHTYSGHENKVAATLKQRIESEHLENKIHDVLVPMQDKIEIKGGKRLEVKEKIFPGYILVKMILDDNTWLAVRTTQGVTSFVGIGNKPTPIPESEVQTIIKFTEIQHPTFKQIFAVDDTIKIVDGPFSDFIGKIESVDEEKGKVRVLVSIFGRETPVELDFLQVQKI